MNRVEVNKRTLLVDINKLYDIIEKDLVENAKHVLWEYDYYTKKYRGDLLNDVNVGIIQNSALEFVAQIYLNNIEHTRKSHLVFSRDLRRISRVDELINTNKPKEMKIKLRVYDDKPLEDRLKEQLDVLRKVTDFSTFNIDAVNIEGDDIIYTLTGNK